jgi:hypothetical protein
MQRQRKTKGNSRFRQSCCCPYFSDLPAPAVAVAVLVCDPAGISFCLSFLYPTYKNVISTEGGAFAAVVERSLYFVFRS